MKRIAALSLFVCLSASTASAAIDAAWTASADEKRPERVYVQMNFGRHHNMGTTMRLADLAGLTAAQIQSSSATTVRFELRREAGTATYEGSFRNGKGAGQMTFAANPNYVTALRNLGVAFELEDDRSPEDEQLFVLALHDVSTSFIRSMQSVGYRVTLQKYLEMRIFDITPEYVQQMRALGISELSADDLVAAGIHKVSPEYVTQMHQLGYALPLDDLMAFRIHKVTPDFIKELRTLGYTKVAADDLVAMRIHKVTPDYIRELRDAGYTGIPVDKLVEMRIRKVDAKFLRAMRER